MYEIDGGLEVFDLGEAEIKVSKNAMYSSANSHDVIDVETLDLPDRPSTSRILRHTVLWLVLCALWAGARTHTSRRNP